MYFKCELISCVVSLVEDGSEKNVVLVRHVDRWEPPPWREGNLGVDTQSRPELHNVPHLWETHSTSY